MIRTSKKKNNNAAIVPVYTCPLSLEPPRLPVMADNGRTYDFAYIVRALLVKNSDPFIRKPIKRLTYNRAIKDLNDELTGNVSSLTEHEKIDIADLYQQITTKYPKLEIHGISNVEGLYALINTSTSDFATDKTPTPLYLAVQKGQIDLVRTMLTNPRLDPDIITNDGNTALSAAIKANNADIVRLLLNDSRVNPNQLIDVVTYPYSEVRAGILICAAIFGTAEIIKTLLADLRIDPNQIDSYGSSSLKCSLEDCDSSSYMNLFNALLDDPRVDPNISNPLAYAAVHGHKDAVIALLNCPRLNPDQALIALYETVLYKNADLDIVKHLLPNTCYNNDRFLNAADQGYSAFITTLLAEETARDHYLAAGIQEPHSIRYHLQYNPVLFNALVSHQNQLWSRLQQPEAFNLSAEQHTDLLDTILMSRQQPDRKQHHPLYMLFKRQGLRSFFSSSTAILEEMQAQVSRTRCAAVLS